MKIKTAEFLISNTDYTKCPEPNMPEYAFIGRSNVGKSSLINMLTNHKNLAKVSGRPGKTQLINHFVINKDWYLVDLPGFGYAKTSKSNRAVWQKFVQKYMIKRTNLYCVFVLIDSRLEPQKIDLEFIEWLGKEQIPFAVVFTKADKLKANPLSHNIQVFQNRLYEKWAELPSMFVTSAEKHEGKEELLSFIDEINESEKK